MPVLAYFAVITPCLLFALFFASAFLDPSPGNNGAKLLGIEEARASNPVSVTHEEKPEMFDRLRALRIHNVP